MNNVLPTLLVALSLLAMRAEAVTIDANALNLVQSNPDISAIGNIQHSYTPGTNGDPGVLIIESILNSSALVFLQPDLATTSDYSEAPGMGFVSYFLTAEIDENGLLSSGNFSITNITGINYLGAADGEVLLAGTLNDFGYTYIGNAQPDAVTFEFRGEVDDQGGVNPLTADFLDGEIGITYNAVESTFKGDFTSAFSSNLNSDGFINTFIAIPEPTAALVGSLGLFGLIARRKNRRG